MSRTECATDVPLRRNWDFLLLQAGQLLSTTGSQTASVAYPLLVLAVTGSPALAGLVAFARVVPAVLFSLLGGIAADRFSRKMLMIVADTLRMAAIGTLVAAILLDSLHYWHIVVVAFVEGSLTTVFNPAATAALRSVVPVGKLPAAVATQQARSAVASLSGPPLGGALFGLNRAFPFLADAVSYLFSMLAIFMIRKPLEEQRAVNARTGLRAQLAEGWHFLWQHPFLRTTTFLYGLTNFVGAGVMLAIVVVGAQQGLSGARIGVMLAAFSGCVFVGSLISGAARRRLSTRAIMLLELMAWPWLILFTIWPNAYLLVLCILPAAIAIPITDSIVISYRLAITPDQLVGRVESVRSTVALALAPIGSLTAGILLTALSARTAMLVFAVVAVWLALWGILSPVVRNAPSLADMTTNRAG